MQQTEIIKLNSLKSSISSLFQNLTSKCNSTKDYDITVIVKQSDTPQSPTKKVNTVGFNDNPMILNDELSQSYISLDQNVQSNKSIHSEHTIDEKKHKMPSKIRFKKKDEKENAHEMKAKTSTQMQTQEYPLPTQNQNLHTQFKIEESPSNSERYSFKLNNVDVESENSEEDSQAADGQDGGFLIEKCLNQALELIESNQMEELQEFLYKFKQKHSFTNPRAEAKWSLLMGYCKENKLEFERAATNYAQVIASITKNPLMVTVELADILCRLGRCYFEIGEWNKAIAAYSCSLNLYKKNKKCLNYANCITNLGVLYLEIGYFIEAQRCFLMAFDIKRCEGDKKDKKSRINLLQTYFHLFDCNLSLKNLIQCEQILGNVCTIIQETQALLEPLLKVRYFIRCGKLLFFQGKLQYCQNYYHHALNLLKRHSLINVQHAEVMELIAILKQEMEDFERSKYYYEKAYHYLHKCVASDSPKLEILKRKIDAIGEALARARQDNHFRFNKNTMFTEQGGRGKEIDKRKRNSTEKIMRERVEN